MRGEFEHQDSIRFDDSQKFVTPGGKIVYGGGGIMPDVFVPVDTTGSSEYYNKIRSLGLMYRFAFYYTDLNRDALEAFTTAADIEGLWANERVLGLAEMMNFPGVLFRVPAVLEKLAMSEISTAPVVPQRSQICSSIASCSLRPTAAATPARARRAAPLPWRAR